jgi:hypothetical protein
MRWDGGDGRVVVLGWAVVAAADVSLLVSVVLWCCGIVFVCAGQALGGRDVFHVCTLGVCRA